ncbi:GNAT family N-acetyltransferase [Marimonas sp. MJW-29]|uniref:GNAT family N-acetyltransferase n=1 Tax=Sulfitobacter sediminis TaxID=3234186 RepID=A0ABV3RIC4_9RHOB
MFDTTCASPSSALMQDAAFAEALRRCGQTPVSLPSGHLLLRRRVLGISVLMLPRAAPPADLQEQLHGIGLHRAPLILSPELPCPLPPALKLMAPRNRAVWSINLGREALRRGLHPKWRNQLRKAERQSISIRPAPLRLPKDQPFLDAAARQARARRYAGWPTALTASFADVSPSQTHLFQALCGKRVLAQMLFLTHGQHATYHIGLTSDAGRRVCAHNLILWKAARHLAAKGCESIDLGVLDDTPAALVRFKLRTGADICPTGGTHLYWRPLARS